MNETRLMFSIIFCCLLSGASNGLCQTSEPAARVLVLPPGPLQITVTGVDGIVRVRPTPNDKWVRAAVGMVLDEGAEFQTGPRSAVRFVIPPDQTISLDRLGTIKILRANFESGTLFTDLGMKYGRTRYDIEGAGRDHDAKVHSPGAVMAIRGTQVSLFDQPPFTPSAVSLTGRARFIVGNKVIPFGGKGQGTTSVDASSGSPAQAALVQTELDPKGQFAGRTQNDLSFQLAQAAFAGTNFASVGVVPAVVQPGVTVVPVPPAPPTPPTPPTPTVSTNDLSINLYYQTTATGENGSTFDLTITDPLGQVLNLANPKTADGGVFNGVTNAGGMGIISAGWPKGYPIGTFTFTTTLLTGGGQPSLTINDLNPTTGVNMSVGPIGFNLTAANPKSAYTVALPLTSSSTTTTVPTPVTPTPARPAAAARAERGVQTLVAHR